MGICLDYARWSTALCNQKGVFILHILKNLIIGIGCMFALAGCGRQVSYVSQDTKTGLGVNALTTGENSVDDSTETQADSPADGDLTTQTQTGIGADDPADERHEQIGQPAMVAVYVCGAVKHPGVYTFSEGARMNELIEQAGGFTKDAAVTYLNLAETVTDSEKI